MLQLEKIVRYHKALADATRIRILILLAKGPLSGQELAEKLAVSPPTVTHHMGKLREAALIIEWRDKNSIYFQLNDYFLKQNAEALNRILFPAERSNDDMNETSITKTDVRNDKMLESVRKNFFTPDGRLKQIPVQRKKKLIAFEEMLKGLAPGTKYTEKEINEHIRKYHDDVATIRREFIINQYMYRDHDIYELNPVELWVKWRELQ